MASDTSALDPEDIRVGATIKALREAHGLGQREMARLVGISDTLLNLIEHGKRTATPRTCRAITDKLGIPLAAITVKDYARVAAKLGIPPEAMTADAYEQVMKAAR